MAEADLEAEAEEDEGAGAGAGGAEAAAEGLAGPTASARGEEEAFALMVVKLQSDNKYRGQQLDQRAGVGRTHAAQPGSGVGRRSKRNGMLLCAVWAGNGTNHGELMTLGVVMCCGRLFLLSLPVLVRAAVGTQAAQEGSRHKARGGKGNRRDTRIPRGRVRGRETQREAIALSVRSVRPVVPCVVCGGNSQAASQSQ
jgi:hypothetical protein